ncbi:MAG TPA: head GIN domain-containing protein [Ohtaekwangia sp.]|nr:head GIN domain-containing protein [Ohtaekwangia sp.]
MKIFRALVIVLFSSLTVAAQQTETRETGAFSGVKAAEGVDVYLKKGDMEQVKVEVTGTQTSNVITEVSGSYLKIHMKDVRERNVSAKVYVTYVSLDKVSASSAGSIFSEGTLQARDMEISASSAGSIDLTVEAETLSVSSSTAGDVELKGKVRSISADASTAGEIDAYDLQAEEVDAEASTGGSVKINAQESLTARASSGGSIRYRGSPDRSDINSSTGGAVRKSN